MAKSRTSFKPGQSGNPSGRPAVVTEIRDLARQYSEEAFKGLLAIGRDPKAPPSAKAAAWTEVLNRAHGKAPQSLEIKGSFEAHVVDMVSALDAILAEQEATDAASALIEGECEEVPDDPTKH